MLVESNKRTKSCRIKDVKHQTRAGSVTLEDLTLDEGLACIRSEFLPDLLLGLAERESFGLSEEVRQEDTVVFTVCDGVVGVSGCKEIRGDEFSALVDELVERVLSVCARCAPDNRLYEFCFRTFEEER